MSVNFRADAPNTGVCSLKVGSLATTVIRKNVTDNLDAGDIKTNQLITVVYDGSVFQLSSRSDISTTAGTYNNVTVNNRGLVTSGSNVAYLTGNQSVTLSGDVTGTGTTSISTTVARINGATLGSTTATGGNLLIGGGTQWVSTAVSGDATLSAAGVITVNQNSNNYIKNQTSTDQSAGFRINGNGIFNGGKVGIGATSPAAKLTVGNNLGGAAASTTFITNAGTLGTTAGNTLKLASIGYLASSNEVSLGFEARRTSNGSDWTTTAVGLKYDVDATSPVNNAQIWLTSAGNTGIGTLDPSKKLEVNGDVYTRGKLYQSTSDGQGSGAHGISWYRNDYVTWYDYMAPAGATNAPNGTGAPSDATSGVTSWARRFNTENAGGYGWSFESGPNDGTQPTIKFSISSSTGNFHSTGNAYIDGKIFQKTSAGLGSGAHGISWYDPSFVTWFDYMSNSGSTNAPNGTGAPTDATVGVTSWARRFNIESIGSYGWLFESGPNTGTQPTVKFAINAADGSFHNTGNGFVDGNLQVNASAYWGTNLTRTETRVDAGLQGNAGARSGYFETDAPSPAANWYSGASSWQHLLDVRHNNPGNNYAMQLAGSFFDQKLYFRKTNNSASQAWSEVMTTSSRRAETYHSFNQPSFQSGTYIAWFPAAGGEGSDDAGGGGVGLPQNRNCSWVAPASGRLLRVVLRTDNGSSNGGTEIRGRVAISINGGVTTYTGVNINLDQDQAISIDIPITESGFAFSTGDLINVGINVSDQAGCPGSDCWIEDNDYFASCVWQYTN